MSNTSFGTEINIPKKRVKFYNRSGSAVTIYEGMPVCYMFDTTNNILGYSKSSAAKGTTTAEGSQNEGKFLIVELPEIDNQDWFAGVVANGGYCGKSVATLAYKWLDIYEPDGKSIVPVRANVNTVTGRTILAITDDGQALVNPVDTVPAFGSTAGSSDARPVAIAEETIATLSATAGIVLARLCPQEFIHQGGQIGYELQVAAGTADVAVNKMFLTFIQTGGTCQVLHAKGILSAAGSNCRRGMFRFETFITESGASAQTEEVSCLNVTTELDQTSTVTSGGGRFYGAHVQLRSRAFNPNLSSSIIATLALEYILTKTTTSALDNPPSSGCLIYANCDEAGSVPNYFIQCMGNSGKAIGYTAHSAAAAGGGSLKINISGIGDRYIMLSTAA